MYASGKFMSKFVLLVVMATVRVGPVPNRSRTAWNRNRNRNVRDRFRTGPEPRNREPVGKKLPEPWNRRKKPQEPDQRTVDRFTRPTGSVEPFRTVNPDRTGSPGPAVPWNRNRNRTVPTVQRFFGTGQSDRFLVKVAVTIYSINTHHFQTFQFTTHLFSFSLYLIT